MAFRSPQQQTEPWTGSSPAAAAKRRKRNNVDARQRVTRACDRCKRRKVRCNGVRPCAHCGEAGMACTYDLSYARGRLPSIPCLSPDGHPRDTGGDPERDTGPGTRLHTHPGHPGRRPVFVAGADTADNTPVESAGRLSFLSAAAAAAAEAVDTENTDPRPAEPAPPPPAPEPTTAAPSARVSPEPLQTDQQGHYVGPASGVSFLLRVQKRLHDNVAFAHKAAPTSIFTFGDAPLPADDDDDDDGDNEGGWGRFGGSQSASFPFLFLLTRASADQLLARYFSFAVPTHRFLHQPTVEAWLDEFYEGKGRRLAGRGGGGNGTKAGRDDARRARVAVLFMVFAQARDYMPPSAVRPDMDTSARYYRTAEQLLATETGAVRLASVQARLCQCFYLLSQSRINHCWSLFGTTAHLALAIGLNRNRRADPAGAAGAVAGGTGGTGGLGFVDVECRRRTFWCAYSLDNYLSAALGRPRTFHEEDIDQELPSIVDDGDLLHHAIRAPAHAPPRGQPVMLAPVAHVRLSKIVSRILRDLYAIRPISSAARAALSAKHTGALEAWRRDMARFLDADAVSASLLIPIFQRQRHVLNLAYWHAVLLTHRPLLLSNFAYLQRRRTTTSAAAATATAMATAPPGEARPDARDQPARAQAQDSMLKCLDAAMHIIQIVDGLFHDNQLFRAYWFTMYFAFSAVVVVYVYVIQHQSSPPEAYRAYWLAAVACQGQIAHLAEDGSLTQRYSLVLEELRLVTLRQTGLEPTGAAVFAPNDGTAVNNNNNTVSLEDNVSYAENSLVASGNSMDGTALHTEPPQTFASVPPGPSMAPTMAPNLPPSMVQDMADWSNESPSSSLADVTSWGYFDSMVSSGVWPLDSLLNDDFLSRV
ncbi:nonribosomal peptide synthetase-like protein [Niveomyces insectorum RCEF 264]|uniref:Nonribosomal peptide synthetase-like protein n=1 Tax=Niveomyces insectorum RCEF 264 TaxID=1081102 RepID=A0A167ZW37_9HYPO|nr:nonribosomal peptide synthetase-like protein [Niveomyces insectorum RCEF 264]